MLTLETNDYSAVMDKITKRSQKEKNTAIFKAPKKQSLDGKSFLSIFLLKQM